MEVKCFESLEYVIEYPRGYEEGKRYPVILFMHGAGTRSNDIQVLKNNLFFRVTRTHDDFPFVLVAPHCKSDTETWLDHFESVKRFVSFVQNEAYTDAARLYLMGNSMGGYATWALAMSMPDAFAAAVPICGGGMYWNAAMLKNVPIWAFHGTLDDVVYLEDTVKLVNAVNKNGGSAKLTVYTDCYHDSWTKTFENIEVFNWLLTHEKKGGGTYENKFQGAEQFG